MNDFVGFELMPVNLSDLCFYDLAGFGWIWADFCRFGWICPDLLRVNLKADLLHFDLSGCWQDLCDFVGFVSIWADLSGFRWI